VVAVTSTDAYTDTALFDLNRDTQCASDHSYLDYEVDQLCQ
jgi:hypothetical protein